MFNITNILLNNFINIATQRKPYGPRFTNHQRNTNVRRVGSIFSSHPKNYA